MRKLFFLFFTLSLSLCAVAQTKVGAEQQKQVVAKIDKATATMKSMQCDFTQTKKMKLLKKEMVSKGLMYYKAPGKLRWQYTSPYDYTFILNGNQVHIKSGKSTQNIDVQRNKMFRQIADIILKSITGGNLKSNNDFNLEIWKNGNTYSAWLYPKKKELKQLYKVIEIFFNPQLTMVTSVRMEEKTGDVTIVKLNNVKTGTTISDKVFSIN
ncbi:MAG: outer membrane lipoprotein carrier protein LolA [Prevotella sp.]|nr:outer membrane lipoprotein carrier protein LolA [Prevotella sp.]